MKLILYEIICGGGTTRHARCVNDLVDWVQILGNQRIKILDINGIWDDGKGLMSKNIYRTAGFATTDEIIKIIRGREESK